MSVAALVARSLGTRRARPLLAAAGVATCTLLVLALAGAFHGVRSAMDAYVGQRSVDLWMAPPGADNLIRGSFSSLIPLAYADSLRAMPGVLEVEPVLKAFLPLRSRSDSAGTRRVTLLAIGYRVPDAVGGPPTLARGRAPKGRHEIALDRAAAWRLGVGAGDTVVLGALKVTVTGLTRGTNILATQFMFADFDAAAAIAGVKGQASFLLVRLAADREPDATARTLEARFSDFYFFTRARFLINNQREVSAGFLPILSLIAALGIVAAAVLVGLLMHGVVEERRAEIAVLLALGADAAAVGSGVMRHAVGLLLTGLTTGIAAAVLVAAVLDHSMPIIPMELSPGIALGVAGIFLVAGLGSAMAPVFALRRIDPLEAFRP